VKYKFFIVLLVLINQIADAQPNVCINPPAGFQKGGDFDIIVQRNGADVVDNYLCIPEKVAVEQIGVINKSSFTNNSIRYIFGVDYATIIPANIPFTSSITVDGQSAGEFWIMQIGEEAGQKKLNCKKIQVDASDRPKVELSSCNNQNIALKIETANPVSYYTINWSDGKLPEKIDYTNAPITVQHIYTSSASNSIEVLAVYENTQLNKTCNSIPIKITPPSIFHISSLETQDFGNQVNAILKIKNPTNEKLDIQISDDGGIIYKDYGSTTLSTYMVGNLAKNETCFRLKYKNSTSCTYESPPICSISPKADNSQYGQIDLNWNSTGINTIYDVKRIGGIAFTANGLTKTNYSDKKPECSGNYLYQIIGKYKDNLGNEVSVLSYQVRSNANFNQNLLSKQALVATVLNDGRPQLNILDATGTPTYIIYRSINGQNYTKISETPENQFTDIGNANVNKYCYYINYIDACNTLSPNSSISCTIFLEGNPQQLTWNKPSDNAQTQISYQIIEVPDNNILTTQAGEIYAALNPQKQQQQYQIIANITFAVAGKIYQTQSVSNIVQIDFTTKIYLPNTFTPNNDNFNDTFEIKGDITSIKDFEILIYNQWGKLIFESNDMNDAWNGTLNGAKVKEGTYAYRIHFKDKFGLVYNQNGQLLLLK
jgi:gliding motility-associated-like protein